MTNFEHVECSLPCLGFQAAKDIILKDMIEVGKANGLRGFEQVRMFIVSRVTFLFAHLFNCIGEYILQTTKKNIV